MIRTIAVMIALFKMVFSDIWESIKEYWTDPMAVFEEAREILAWDGKRKVDKFTVETEEDELDQLLTDIEYLETRLKASESKENEQRVEILEKNEQIKLLKQELELVKFQFKQSETDLEYELHDIVNHLITEEKKSRAEAEEKRDEAAFDKLEDDDFESDCVMISIPKA